MSRNERSSGSCFIRYCASSGRDDRKRRGIFLFRIILTIKLRIGGRRMKKFAFKCHNLYRLLSLVEQISRRRENFPFFFFFFFCIIIKKTYTKRRRTATSAVVNTNNFFLTRKNLFPKRVNGWFSRREVFSFTSLSLPPPLFADSYL